ncbi:MAG: DUF4340 domain-containing protein [Gammaproteobacteria bacterium]|nr:DUF4340 domain-containing protein [Gammaproteobacteria bacterium]MBT4493868.1 DUF4340 domain-containing protein [Gammaproteobacteria bacterium]
MNSTRKTLFWLITLLLVAGGFYVLDQQVAEQDRITEENLRLFHFTPDDVEEFWIAGKEDGLRVKVHRRDGEWWLKFPIVARGDDSKIDSLLTNVVVSRKDRTLFEEADAGKMQELGLDTPSIEMTFITSGVTEHASGTPTSNDAVNTAVVERSPSKVETTIFFGDSGPTNNVAYAMLSKDSRVFRIHSDVRTEADRSVYDLRDKSLLSFDPLKLLTVDITRRDLPHLVIEHDNGRWNMLEPSVARASQQNVLEGLFMIKDDEIKAFLGGDLENKQAYGLDAPRIRISIKDQQRDEPYVLIIGDKDRSRRGYFALTNRSEEVLVVTEDLVNYLLSIKDSWQEIPS